MGAKGELGGRKAVLGDAVRDGQLLWVSCTGCRHRVRRVPAELARVLGYDYPLPDLPTRMKCSKCGCREVEVRLEQPRDGPVARHD